MNGPRLLRLAEVKLKTGLGRSTIYSLEAAGRFPHRIKLSSHSVAWLESDVDAWIAARVEASRALPAPKGTPVPKQRVAALIQLTEASQ
jgi:prophage regulatory protein